MCALFAARGARADDAVGDVHVRGTRSEPVRTSVSEEEVRQLPGVFGDPFRAIDALPGIVPMVSGVPFFFVRGAPPGDVGTFLDGIRVPLLYHLALGPSVVHPGIVDRVDLYKGAYPAKYGRHAGGIVAAEVKPPADHLHGEANVRLFDTGGLVEAPFLGGRVTALAAGRFSYAAALVSAFAPDTRVQYADYQGRVVWRATERDAVSVFAFGSFDEILSRDTVREPYDVLARETPRVTKTQFFPLFRTVFHRVDTRWDHVLPRGRVRTALTLGADESLIGDRNGSTGVTATTLGGRTQWDQRLSGDVRVRAGADVAVQQYGLAVGGAPGVATDPAGLYTPRQDPTVGVHGAAAFVVWRRLELEPGLRLDVYASRPLSAVAGVGDGPPRSTASALAVEPRLRARLTLSRRVAYTSTFGIAHQPPSFVVPLPGLSIGHIDRGLQTAVQASQGLELRFPFELTLTVTGFLHAYENLTDATATCMHFTSPDDTSRDCLDQRVRGRAFGLEVMLRRPLTRRLSGWVSYTLSRSTRDTSGLVVVGRAPRGEGEILADYDRTHVLALVGTCDLGAGWRAGVRFMFYTGRPYSKKLAWVPLPPYNADRLPDFARADLRIEKRWRAFRTGTVAVVLEWMNATLAPEAIGVDRCTLEPLRSGAPINVACTFRSIGPVSVPSVGVEAVF